MVNQKIPSIFVINLLRDIDRKNHIIKILKPLNVDYEFFEAVDGKQLSQSEITKIYDSKTAKKLRKVDLLIGEIGCSLSHLGVYKKMLAQGIQQAIILEDDAVIEDGFLQVINEIRHFPNDWELILLGHGNAKYDCKIKQTTLNNLPDYYLYQSIAKLPGMYGYIINQQGATKILDANQKIYHCIDYFTGNYKIVNFYAIYPPVVNVDLNISSSINDEILNKRYKSSFKKVLSAINKKRKNAKWLRKIECLVRKIKFKL